jgi:hypothetical protein
MHEGPNGESPRPRRRAAVPSRGRRPLIFASPVAIVAIVATGAALAVWAFFGVGGTGVAPIPPGSEGAARATSRTAPAAPSRPATESARLATGSAIATRGPAPAPKKVDFVVAWQPSHQNDTGPGWHEYVICGDIVDRTIAQLPMFTNVKAWDLRHGLTGTNNYRPTPANTRAFDVEVGIANKAGADLFISVHTDGGAPSGILGEYPPGDKKSEALTRKMVAALCAKTGLHNRGCLPMRLYSFESVRNHAKLRVLLEIGDNVSDRAFLTSPSKRQLAAKTMADLLAREFAGR